MVVPVEMVPDLVVPVVAEALPGQMVRVVVVLPVLAILVEEAVVVEGALADPD